MERILLIGKGRILLDGSLQELKSRHSGVRKITVSHSGGETAGELAGQLPEGIVCTENQPGQSSFAVDTTRIGVSEAIGILSGKLEITDLSVAGATAEELVVSLYEEFAI